jgi:hypothetical protein
MSLGDGCRLVNDAQMRRSAASATLADGLRVPGASIVFGKRTAPEPAQQPASALYMVRDATFRKTLLSSMLLAATG